MGKRAQWKGPVLSFNFYQLLFKNKAPIITQNRNITIIPALLGKIVKVYTGKVYINVKITQEMLGYKIGSFALTKKRRKKK
jgi:ribosomal protein S19